MAVLITGGSGKTARHLKDFLRTASVSFVLTSRRGPAGAPDGFADKTVIFDMLDESTFSNPFEFDFPNGIQINSLYLIAPECEDPIPALDSFIKYSVKHGVKKVIMLAGSTAEISDSYVKEMWRHLKHMNVEYCVLRPTWFNGISTSSLYITAAQWSC
jgi:festuclavine dehydrogenase